MTRKFRKGDHVWIRCEVKPGPFSNERMVKVKSSEEDWIGFVSDGYLERAIERGQTRIVALITETGSDYFIAKFPGHSISGKIYRGLISEADRIDIVAK